MTGRSNRVESSFEIADKSLRAHLEAALGAIDEGQPRMFARVHLHAMRGILNEAEHGVPRYSHKSKDDVLCAYVPDVVPERG